MSVLKLKEYRKKAKMSQRDVARAMNITQSYYWYWEKEVHLPNARQLKQLCEILNCTPNELLDIKNKYNNAMDKLNDK